MASFTAFDQNRPTHAQVLAAYLQGQIEVANELPGGITLGRICLDADGVLPLTAQVREHGRMPADNQTTALHTVMLYVTLATSYEGDEEAPVVMCKVARRIAWLLHKNTIHSHEIPAFSSLPRLSMPLEFMGQQMLDAEKVDSPEEVLQMMFETGGNAGI